MPDQKRDDKHRLESEDKIPLTNWFTMANYILLMALAVLSQIDWCVKKNEMEQLPYRIAAVILIVTVFIGPLVSFIRFLGRRYGSVSPKDADQAMFIALLPLFPAVLAAFLDAPDAIYNFTVHLGLAGLLSSLLAGVYVIYGTAISNRRQMARQFVPLSMITMAVISFVGGSLVLSLGMVGALSIVRFRAAIKDPEELVYLFGAIGIGLGMGGGFAVQTSVATAVLMVYLIFRGMMRMKPGQQAFHLTIHAPDQGSDALGRYTTIITECVGRYALVRMDQTDKNIEATFLVDMPSPDRIEILVSRFREQHPEVSVILLDGQTLAL